MVYHLEQFYNKANANIQRGDFGLELVATGLYESIATLEDNHPEIKKAKELRVTVKALIEREFDEYASRLLGPTYEWIEAMGNKARFVRGNSPHYERYRRLSNQVESMLNELYNQ